MAIKFNTTNGSITLDAEDGSGNVDLSLPRGGFAPFDANLQSFTQTFTLPTTDGASGQILSTNGAGVLSFADDAGGIALTDLSVGAEGVASGNGSISYDNATGVFTYTPPDLSSYLTSVAFGDLTTTPTTIAGYGITDAFDGAYSSLSGAPTNVSSFTNDAGYITGYTVTQGDVTAHQAALNITESQISDLQNYLTSETNTTLVGDSLNQKLVFTNETGTPVDIDLSWAVDDTNLSRIVSGSVDAGTGIATFTRDDASTFTVDFSALFDDTNLTRITSGSLSGTTLTLTRSDATTVSVNLSSLDSRYQPAGTYNTIIGTDSDINTSGSTIIDNIFVTDGVITSMGTRTLTPADIGAQPAGTYNTVIGTDTDIDTSGATIIDNIYVTDGVITSMGTRTLTAANIGALPTSVANQNLNTNSVPTFTSLIIADSIIHSGDTNTYMQFSSADNWRVVVAGSQRLRADQFRTYVDGDLWVGNDIELAGVTGRIGGIFNVINNTDAASKGYVDNAVASAGGGISNVVEDTTPQLGGDLDIGGNYVGLPNANMSAVDFGTGSIFSIGLQGSAMMDFFAAPGPSSENIDVRSDLTLASNFDLRFQNRGTSIVQRHTSRGITENVEEYAGSTTSISVNVDSNGDSNIQWINSPMTGNLRLDVFGIKNGTQPAVAANTISIVAQMGSTGYIVDQIFVDATAAAINWAGGSAPTPETNAWNIFTFTFLYSQVGILTVLGSHQGF